MIRGSTANGRERCEFVAVPHVFRSATDAALSVVERGMPRGRQFRVRPGVRRLSLANMLRPASQALATNAAQIWRMVTRSRREGATSQRNVIFAVHAALCAYIRRSRCWCPPDLPAGRAEREPLRAGGLEQRIPDARISARQCPRATKPALHGDERPLRFLPTDSPLCVNSSVRLSSPQVFPA
jgi:hypothetical protein